MRKVRQVTYVTVSKPVGDPADADSRPRKNKAKRGCLQGHLRAGQLFSARVHKVIGHVESDA